MASDTYSLTLTSSFEGPLPQEMFQGRPSSPNARTAQWVRQQRSVGPLHGPGAACAFDEAERLDAACMATKFCLPGNIRGPLGLAQPILLQAPQAVTVAMPRQPSPRPMDENLAKCAEHWRKVRAACAERAAQASGPATAGLPASGTPTRG